MIEIMILLQVAGSIGGWMTFSLVLVTAFIGAQLVRQQGISTMLSARNKMESGTLPGQEMVEGVLLLIAGVLLVTPGFVTDAIGFLFVLPMSRPAIATFLMKHLKVSAANPQFQQGHNPFGGSPFTHNNSGHSHNDDVIEGEYHHTEDSRKKLD